MIAHLVTFGLGVLFALGLGLAGLTDPATIVGFLDVTGGWDPTVLVVMATAVSVTAVGYRLTFRRKAPVLAARFGVPTRRDVDRRLVAGAALFGLGWGLVGLCPGPALTSLVAGEVEILAFLAAMLGGMWLYGAWERSQSRAAKAREARAAAAAAEAAAAPSMAPRLGAPTLASQPVAERS